jgi:hypothetical protein
MIVRNIINVIKEANIIVFSPHYDDFPLMMAGYILELKKKGMLRGKRFTNVNVFSRSNYQLRDSYGNKDTSLDRIKFVVGRRIIEDISCMDELFGLGNYTYRLLCENDCQIRGKKTAKSEMEFHHGMYEDLRKDDFEILDRVTDVASEYIDLPDTALIYPIGFKEHIDHFIVREAGKKAAKNGGRTKLYFAEEKPLSGLADKEEKERINKLIIDERLEARTFRCDPKAVIELVFKHYISQVEDVYSKGIFERSKTLQSEYAAEYPLDCIYAKKYDD